MYFYLKENLFIKSTIRVYDFFFLKKGNVLLCV